MASDCATPAPLGSDGYTGEAPASCSKKAALAERYRQKYQEVLHQRQVKLYENAWDECVRREKAAARTEVEFSVCYHTSFGQNLFVVGSAPELGSWDLSKKVHMRWTEGDVWRAKVEFPAGQSTVEYKYVVSQADITLWESGNNHMIQVGAGAVTCNDEWNRG
eukprot:TRINITY_DN29260_c0_g1_i2.p1 TRINITY_DN29260_c0_g1~~TRINITY_DN29260_c0_g1_i2.p1  ORF type:complete len:163 (-),score=35.33 TRINITY_DN29260_c0_g1_i2:32-520(-)